MTLNSVLHGQREMTELMAVVLRLVNVYASF